MQPKDSVKQYVVIEKPNSMLHYSFTTLNYNIGFSIEKVGSLKLVNGEKQEKGNKAFVRYSLCDSHLKPISNTLLVKEPGVYKIIWHNSYSYIKSKTIKYRLRVLSPMAEQTAPVTSTASRAPTTASMGSITLDSLVSCDGNLTAIEENVFKALRAEYTSFIPMVRILRPAVAQTPSNIEAAKEVDLVVYIKNHEDDDTKLTASIYGMNSQLQELVIDRASLE